MNDKLLSRVVYNEANAQLGDNYELQYSTDGGRTWDMQSKYCFKDEEFIHFSILKEIDKLICLGYKFLGVK